MKRSDAYLILYARERAIELGWRFNPFQPRWPRGSGKKSGQWKDDGRVSRDEPEMNAHEQRQYTMAVNQAKRGLPAGKQPTKHQIRKFLASTHPMARKQAPAKARPEPGSKPENEKVIPVAPPPAPPKVAPPKAAPPIRTPPPAPPKKPLVIPPAPRKAPLPKAAPKKIETEPKPPPVDPEAPVSESLFEKKARLERELKKITDFNSPEHFTKMQELLGVMTRIQNTASDDPSMGRKFTPDLNTARGRTAYKRAIAAIEKVHKDSTLKPISLSDLTATPNARGNGHYSFGVDQTGNEKQNYDEIWVSSKNTIDPELTVVHEIGHMLDRRIFGNNGFGSDQQESKELRALRQALSDSDAIKEIRMHLDEAIASSDPEKGRYPAYLLEPTEQFARAYSQWIAVRSGDRGLLAQHMNRALYAQLPVQWNSQDFAPIAKAMDDLFRAGGYLND